MVAYMANTIVGLTSVAACFQGGELTMLEAVKTLLWQGIIAAPVFFVRFAGTYYLGVYGPVLGTKLAFTSYGLNIFVYLTCLMAVTHFA